MEFYYLLIYVTSYSVSDNVLVHLITWTTPANTFKILDFLQEGTPNDSKSLKHSTAGCVIQNISVV